MTPEAEKLILTELSTLPRGKRGRKTNEERALAVQEPQPEPMSKAEAQALARQEVKDMAKLLVTDPIYLINLQKRLRSGAAPPAVEAMVWGYAYGKPKEQIEVKKATVVKILHEYADQKEVAGVVEKVIDGTITVPELRAAARDANAENKLRGGHRLAPAEPSEDGSS